MSSSGEGRAARPARETWVDAAKGIAIILVVLFHSVIFTGDIGLAGFWSRLSDPLDTFRMPLFFFTAGIFAAGALRSTFGQLFRRRVAKLIWLYAVWTLIWSVAFVFIPVHHPVSGAGVDPLSRWALSFVWPNESTWFIYALALYFVVAWVLRRVPVAVQFVAAAALSAVVGSSLVDWPNEALEKICMYFVFYLAAVHTGPWVRRLAPAVTVWQAALVAAVYVAILVPVVKVGALSIPGVRLALGVVGVAAGSAVSIVLARWVAMRWLSALGSRTLQVYLVHFYVVLGVVAALAPVSAALTAWTSVIVPVLTAVAVLAGLGFHRLTRRVPGLWDLPPAWQVRRPGPVGTQAD